MTGEICTLYFASMTGRVPCSILLQLVLYVRTLLDERH
jgi:hypothetical protein